MNNIYVASGSTAFVVTTIIELMKRSPFFKGMNYDTGRVNLMVSAALAFLSSIGIIVGWDFNWSTGDFAAQIHGNLWTVAHLFEHAVLQLLGQHGFYQVYRIPNKLDELIDAMRAISGGVPTANVKRFTTTDSKE